MSDCVSLGGMLWQEEKGQARRRDELVFQRGRAGILARKKWRAEEESAERDRVEWWKLAAYWQGTDHLHRTPPETDERKAERKTGGEKCGPPPYEEKGTSPSAPPAHMCPVVTVTSGTIHIQGSESNVPAVAATSTPARSTRGRQESESEGESEAESGEQVGKKTRKGPGGKVRPHPGGVRGEG